MEVLGRRKVVPPLAEPGREQSRYRPRDNEGQKKRHSQLHPEKRPYTQSVCLQIHLLRVLEFGQHCRTDVLDGFILWRTIHHLRLRGVDCNQQGYGEEGGPNG